MPVLENNVLDPEKHARLIADLENISSVAGVQVRFIENSMKTFCGPIEIDWVRNFKTYRAKGIPGLVMENLPNPDSRCQAIAAALLRNYIDARVVPLGTLLDMQKEGSTLNPSVLLVPNFFVKMDDKGIPGWRMQGMYDLLLQRAVHNKPTVLYVQSMEGVKNSFGPALEDFLSHFVLVKN